MAVVAALVLLAGACMVLVTGIFALISIGNLRMARLLRATPPTPIGSWRPGTARVAAEGITEHGPAGPQTGPLSGEKCTWFRLDANFYRAGGDTDEDWGTEVAASPSWPSLADSSGRVSVDPRTLTSQSANHAPPAVETVTVDYVHRKGHTPPPLTPPTMAAKLRPDDRVRLHEVRLPHGREVFALARVTSEGLAPAGRGRTIFTPGHWADVIKAKEDDLRLMTVTIPIMFAGGLVLSGGALTVLLAVSN